MTTCRNAQNLTPWLVLSAAGIGEGANLQGKRTCRQIKPQRTEATPKRMNTVPDDPSSSETMQGRA
jgi:hypothetical protein